MPRGPILFATRDLPSHPFPTIFPAAPEECVPKLISLLPKKDELFTCLQSFEARVNLSSFPHVPFEITRSEMERFLSDVDRNASVCPDMLALLFAALALGGQHSVWEKAGRQWKTNAVLSELKKGDVFSVSTSPLYHTETNTS